MGNYWETQGIPNTRTESGDPAIPGVAARRPGILDTAGGVYHIATNAEGAWETSPCLGFFSESSRRPEF